jgi:hypothetical protein
VPGGASAGGACKAPVLRWLIHPTVDHPGAGSCVIDHAVGEDVLCCLERVFERLPLEPRCKESANDRAYLADSEGWVARALRQAVRAVAHGQALPVRGEAMAQMRFLLYAEEGGGLPPHIDLTRTDEAGTRSTHTFILYLTDCASGGETELLRQHAPTAEASRVVASVTPARGRLLFFPHDCPHFARPVTAEGLPKLLLRGEIY